MNENDYLISVVAQYSCEDVFVIDCGGLRTAIIWNEVWVYGTR